MGYKGIMENGDNKMIDMTHDAESMAVCAIRYTIGRQSYIVSDGQRWAIEWGRKSGWVRRTITRDLQEAIDRCDDAHAADREAFALGSRFDEEGWRNVMRELQAMELAVSND
jgi:hypothetical protein